MGKEINHNIMCLHAQLLGRVQLFAVPWTVGCQAPLSMEFSRQKYCSGLPFPTPGIEPMSRVSPALAGGFYTTELPEKTVKLE